MSIDDRLLFIALVESGSYAATARKLGIARSTVMRRIAALEAELGVTLVHRAGRAIVMTEAGNRFAEGLRGVFRALERVEEDVRSSSGHAAGTLRLWLPMLGTPYQIVDALAEFVRTHPQIQLRVDLGRSPRAPRLGEFDLMMQVGNRHNPDLRSRTLYRDQLILVASAVYLAQRGVPERITDLAQHRAIEQRDPSGRVIPWRMPNGERVRMPPIAVSTHATGYVHAFALHGVGIGRVPRSMARSTLQDGQLQQVLDEVVVEEPVNLVYLPDPSPTTRAFIDFMVQHSIARRSLLQPASGGA
ncbi:MAG: LysR family transcriptional regulator [Myxococcota bacterium]